MKTWKTSGSGLQTTYENDRKIVSDFLGAKGRVTFNDTKEYDLKFCRDYLYPISVSPLKILSIIFLLIFTCSMFFTPVFKEWVAFAVCSGLILLSFLAFGWVRRLQYPNGKYPVFFIVLLSLIATGLIAASCFYKETFVTGWYYLDKAYDNGLVSSNVYESVAKIATTFFYIACGLSLIFIVIGASTSKRRFSSIMVPLIAIGGLLAFFWFANIPLNIEEVKLETNAVSGELEPVLFITLLTVGLLIMFIYDFVFCSIAKAIGGK